MNDNGFVQLATQGFEHMAAHIKEQSKFNRNCFLFVIAVTAHALVQHKRIQMLSDEVKELKRTRGE